MTIEMETDSRAATIALLEELLRTENHARIRFESDGKLIRMFATSEREPISS
jgi:hypothetical protein